MNTISSVSLTNGSVATASTSTILAIDLGKYKSVACVHDSECGEFRFTTFDTSRGPSCPSSWPRNGRPWSSSRPVSWPAGASPKNAWLGRDGASKVHPAQGRESSNPHTAWDRGSVQLASVGLPPHCEPERCEIFSCDMYGYSGIHYLRRIAAHLDLRGALPPPGGEDASKDEVMEEYYRLAGQEHEGGLLGRLFRRAPPHRTFDHLLLHSDAEGYYLPQDFSTVLFPPQSFQVPGEMVGSSTRLLDECKRLAEALQVPLDLDPEAEEVWEATNSQGHGNLQWQRYGIESFVCLRLYNACERSLEHHAAIVFC
jgi:hypothetical protein